MTETQRSTGTTGSRWGSERPVRADGIDITTVSDGYVVYDADRDRVHYLNHTAALVLELCTGDTRADEMAGLLQAAYDLPDPPDAEARQCLEQLRREGLIS